MTLDQLEGLEQAAFDEWGSLIREREQRIKEARESDAIPQVIDNIRMEYYAGVRARWTEFQRYQDALAQFR
jgi:hypothetical protein